MSSPGERLADVDAERRFVARPGDLDRDLRADVTGDLYAASDFGVMRLANGSTSWTVAGSGMPMVEVPGLTIVPGARLLYAATHGRSAWLLPLK